MADFTPGPWEVRTAPPEGETLLAWVARMLAPGGPEAAVVLGGQDSDGVSLVVALAGNGPTREANAALIAAAPELYEALEETLALASVADEGDPWFAESAGIDAGAVLGQAAAALAKARGEA